MTDADIRRLACTTNGCVNYTAKGYIVCETCLHGLARPLEPDDAARKLELEKTEPSSRETMENAFPGGQQEDVRP